MTPFSISGRLLLCITQIFLFFCNSGLPSISEYAGDSPILLLLFSLIWCILHSYQTVSPGFPFNHFSWWRSIQTLPWLLFLFSNSHMLQSMNWDCILAGQGCIHGSAFKINSLVTANEFLFYRLLLNNRANTRAHTHMHGNSAWIGVTVHPKLNALA